MNTIPMIKIKKGLYIFILSFLYISQFAFGQSGTDVETDSLVDLSGKIFVRARSYQDSVVLRWAPNTPEAWYFSNFKGYSIQRIKLKKDSTLDLSTKKILNPNPIKVAPLDAWEKIVNPDNPDKYAAIAAQMVYGEGYNTESAFEKSDEFQNRFSYALLAADISSKTADGLGLRFVDRSIEKGAIYIYYVFPAETIKDYKIDTGVVLTNTVVKTVLPEVIPSEIMENEKRITLGWDRNYYKSYYSAYYIERSTDDKNFIRLNKEPFINPFTDDFGGNSNRILYTDSLENNYKKYYYRIIGISSFGDVSKATKSSVAMGRDKTPPSPPQNLKTTPLGGNKVEITWEKETEEPDILGYVIGKSQNALDGFEPINDSPLPKGTRSFIDESVNENGTNYYLVAAVDTAGNAGTSMASYAMILDSIPPAPPVNIKGSIDSAGVVNIVWDLGHESDLAGYMIYFSNAKDHVFTTLNSDILTDTIYTDTITIKTLTEEIYYTMQSVDINYNYSKFSDTLMLSKPDIIPPMRPVFYNYLVEENGITISWNPSSSKDAVKYEIYRSQTASERSKLAEVKVTDSLSYSFLDTQVEPRKVYQYTLVTVDDAGLKSDFSTPLNVRMADFSKVPSVNNLTMEKLIESGEIVLSWDYSSKENYRLIVYRAVDGGDFQTYKSLKKGETSFKEKVNYSEKVYEYTIQVYAQNGKKSKFSNIVSTSL